MVFHDKHRIIDVCRCPMGGQPAVVVAGGMDIFNHNLLAQHGLTFNDKASWKVCWRMIRAVATAVALQELHEGWS